jgi:hypothetical protein
LAKKTTEVHPTTVDKTLRKTNNNKTMAICPMLASTKTPVEEVELENSKLLVNRKRASASRADNAIREIPVTIRASLPFLEISMNP